MSLQILFEMLKGGYGSGNWGHAGGKGGPGNRGGSAPKSSAMSMTTGRTAIVRQTLAKAGKQVLDYGLSTGNESVIGIDATGKSIDGMPKGDSNSCDASPVLNNLTYATLHNHPSSSSFSGEDIALFAQPFYKNLTHQVVVGHDGTVYKLSKTKNYKANAGTYAIIEGWKYHKDNLMPYFQKKVDEGLDQNVAWKEHTHRTVKKLAKELGLKYERIEPKKK